MSNLDKLNRLRLNAGKPELKSWKASQAKLDEAVASLEAAGFVDVVPGAKLDIKPVTDDPVVAKALPKDPEPEIRANPEARKEPEVKKQKAQLARGLETEQMARQSRVAVQMERERERREEKAARAEAKAETKKPKEDLDKAARQQKHIEDKKAARAAKPKVEKDANMVTAADMAREQDKDPKTVRNKLRRYKAQIHKLYPKWDGETWSFPISLKPELLKIIG